MGNKKRVETDFVKPGMLLNAFFALNGFGNNGWWRWKSCPGPILGAIVFVKLGIGLVCRNNKKQQKKMGRKFSFVKLGIGASTNNKKEGGQIFFRKIGNY